MHLCVDLSDFDASSYKIKKDIFIQSGVIDIFPKFKMAAAAILNFQAM